MQARNGTEYVFETEEQEVRSLWLDNLRQALAVAAVNQELGRERPSRLARGMSSGLMLGVGIGWLVGLLFSVGRREGGVCLCVLYI